MRLKMVMRAEYLEGTGIAEVQVALATSMLEQFLIVIDIVIVIEEINNNLEELS